MNTEPNDTEVTMNYVDFKPKQPCPSCGHCPTCGQHRPVVRPFTPYQPWAQPYHPGTSFPPVTYH